MTDSQSTGIAGDSTAASELPSPAEYAAVRDILERYIKGSYTGHVPVLRDIFHPAALMAGYLDGALDVGSPEPFYAELEEAASAEATGEAYAAEISSIRLVGMIASAEIVERNLLGHNYVNHFLLIETEGVWRIVAKTYTTVV